MRLLREEIHPWHREEAQKYMEYSESKYNAFEQVIGKGDHPRFIAEIGTHCGYAASMFMRQVPLALFFGFSDASTKNNRLGPVGAEWANFLLRPYKHANLVLWDPCETTLPLPFKVDFIHINSCDYAEKLHFLNVANNSLKKGGYILLHQGLDDFSNLGNQENLLNNVSRDVLFRPYIND